MGAPPPGGLLPVAPWLPGGGGCDHADEDAVSRRIVTNDIFIMIFIILLDFKIAI